MYSFFEGFLRMASYHALGVASPGPDFAIVLHQSIHRGRRAALFTSAGIATGIFFHVAYSLFALQWLIDNAPAALDVIKIFCAAYLAYLGIKILCGIFRKKTAGSAGSPSASAAGTAGTASESDWQSFRAGLLVNILNPKVALFFFAGFTNPHIIAPGQPLGHKAIYGCWMAFATAIWFTCVSCFFTTERIRQLFLRFARYLDLAMAALLLILAGLLVFDAF
jgi:threonine/homoserine/homoserine lactone efflux protein